MLTPPAPWSLTLPVIVAIVTTLGLSYWQFNRGLDKLELRAAYEDALAQPPLADRVDGDVVDYRRVVMTGYFDREASFVVANRHRGGRPGFWVVTVFNTDYGRYLVNRGWVPAGPTFRDLPEIAQPDGPQRLEGVIWPTLPVSALTRSQEWSDAWPVRVRGLDVERMADRTRALAREIRLTSGSDGVFEAVPLAADLDASMHWGYAFQWILIGGLVVVGYWYFGVKQGRSGERNG